MGERRRLASLAFVAPVGVALVAAIVGLLALLGRPSVRPVKPQGGIVRLRLPNGARPIFNVPWIRAVAFGPKPGQMVTGHLGGYITLWDLRTGRILAQAKAKGEWSVRGLTIEPRAGRILVATTAAFEAWAPDLSKRLWRWRTEPLKATSCLGSPIHPSGRLVALRQSRKVLLCDTRSGRVLFSFKPEGRFPFVFFDRIGLRMAVWSGGNSLQIWDLISGRPIKRLKLTGLYDLRGFCAGGGFAYVERRRSGGLGLVVVDPQTGRRLFESNQWGIFSPAGDCFVLFPSLEVRDARTFALLAAPRLEGIEGKVVWALPAPGAAGLLVMTDRGWGYWVELPSGRVVSAIPPPVPEIREAFFVKPDSLMATCYPFGRDKVDFYRWDIATSRPSRVEALRLPWGSPLKRLVGRIQFYFGKPQVHYLTSVTPSPNGKLVALGFEEKVDIFRTAPCLTKVRSLRPNAEFFFVKCLSPRCHLAILHEEDSQGREYFAAYDLRTGDLRWRRPALGRLIQAGASLFEVSLSSVQVIDPATGKTVKAVILPEAVNLYCVGASESDLLAYLPSPRRGCAILFDVKAERKVAEFRTKNPWDVTISPDGRYLAIQGEPEPDVERIFIYEIPSRRLLGSIPSGFHVLFAPGGKRLVITALNEATIYELPSLKVVSRLYILPEGGWLALKPGGLLILPRGAERLFFVKLPDGRVVPPGALARPGAGRPRAR